MSSPRLLRALECLHELRRAMPAQGVSATADSRSPLTDTLSRYVDFVMEKTALAARLEAIGEPGEEAVRHLRLRALEAECEGMTLRNWVGTLVVGLDEAMPMAAGAVNAIQFLTSLKAKGLEWPVIIPLGLGRQIVPRRETYPRVERFEGRAQLHFSNVTVDDEQQRLREERRAEEFQRMLYVTLTRAKSLLLVPDGSTLHEGRQPNMLQLARWGELDRDRLFTTVDVAGKGLGTPPSSGAIHQAPPRVFKENKSRLKRAATASCHIPQRVLPSGLVHNSNGPDSPGGGCNADLADPQLDGDSDRLLLAEAASLSDGPGNEPLAGVGGVDYGNWWHLVLQRYPWQAESQNERDIFRAGELAKIPATAPWKDRAEEELQRLQGSSAHEEFLTRGKVFLPEMPFSFPESADRWVEGIMDLVVITRNGGQAWIVDWKTDRPWTTDKTGGDFLERIAAKYAPQLQAYARVFSQGMGRPISRLLLYSTVLGQTVEVTR